MNAAQPLAVTTTASAPVPASGSQASMLRRANARASRTLPRWNPIAPQQPARGVAASAIPARANTRFAAALNCGAATDCTQPERRDIPLGPSPLRGEVGGGGLLEASGRLGEPPTPLSAG